jgi:hypothetical protein
LGYKVPTILEIFGLKNPLPNIKNPRDAYMIGIEELGSPYAEALKNIKN